MKTLKNIGKFIVVAVCVLIIFFTGKAILADVWSTAEEIVTSEPKETVESRVVEKPDIYDIHANATEVVSKFLKSPSTAEFPVASKLDIVEYEKNNYQVISYVDSQNSFGATVRSEWMVAMELTNDYIRVHQVIIDGKVVY